MHLPSGRLRSRSEIRSGLRRRVVARVPAQRSRTGFGRSVFAARQVGARARLADAREALGVESRRDFYLVLATGWTFSPSRAAWPTLTATLSVWLIPLMTSTICPLS